MFNFKKKIKANINSISVPDQNWEMTDDTEIKKQWINPESSIALSVNFFNKKPDIPTILDIGSLRKFYGNNLAQGNGGIIQVDIIRLHKTAVIKTIFKIPQEQSGITYLGSLTIPFKRCSYVVKIQANEIGMTGIRESVITDRLLGQEVLTLGEEGMQGWNSYPYEHIEDSLPMNKAESIEYDSEFPEHPLTRTRELLQSIESSIEFDSEINLLDPFIN